MSNPFKDLFEGWEEKPTPPIPPPSTPLERVEEKEVKALLAVCTTLSAKAKTKTRALMEFLVAGKNYLEKNNFPIESMRPMRDFFLITGEHFEPMIQREGPLFNFLSSEAQSLSLEECHDIIAQGVEIATLAGGSELTSWFADETSNILGGIIDRIYPRGVEEEDSSSPPGPFGNGSMREEAYCEVPRGLESLIIEEARGSGVNVEIKDGNGGYNTRVSLHLTGNLRAMPDIFARAIRRFNIGGQGSFKLPGINPWA